MKTARQWMQQQGDIIESWTTIEKIQTDAQQHLLTALKEDLACFEWLLVRARNIYGDAPMTENVNFDIISINHITDAIARINGVMKEK